MKKLPQHLSSDDTWIFNRSPLTYNLKKDVEYTLYICQNMCKNMCFQYFETNLIDWIRNQQWIDLFIIQLHQLIVHVTSLELCTWSHTTSLHQWRHNQTFHLTQEEKPSSTRCKMEPESSKSDVRTEDDGQIKADADEGSSTAGPRVEGVKQEREDDDDEERDSKDISG